MQDSAWLADVRNKMAQDQWPTECQRCQATERMPQARSIRLDADGRHKILSQIKSDYVILGGVLDNVCNSACQSCQPQLSTKIGSLSSKNYLQVDNSNKFWQLPLHRVVQLDINGGEPSASPNYRRVLQNLPPNVHTVRVNTNCSSVISELADIAAQGIHVTVTVSFDGVGDVHDYVRWPIAWKKFEQNLAQYRSMPGIELNHWITVNALNVTDLDNIFDYLDQHNSKYDWAMLHQPSVLNVRYFNRFTQQAVDTLKHPNSVRLLREVACDVDNDHELMHWLQQQDQLRKISAKNYYPQQLLS
jgi:sulfatase maturation enzyme AslB (radical SAM superfamily)